MNYKKLTVIAILFLIVCFGLFVFNYEREVRKADKLRVVEHATVIANSIWNFNTKGSLEYLTLACDSLGYERIAVKDNKGTVIQSVISQNRPPFFSTPVLIQNDITYNDRIIGSIEVVLRSRTIYTYFYLLIVGVMLVIMLHLYLRILSVNSLLEQRVQERTKELGESEAKFRSVVENMNEGLVISDMYMNPLYVNPKMCEMANCTAAEILQGGLSGYFDKESIRMLSDQREILAEGGLPDFFAEAISPEDGSKRKLHILTSPLFEDDQINASISIVRDITDELKTQELMIQYEKMMSIGGLAAGMAHELNNPLGGMLQGIQNIQRRFSPDLKSNTEAAKETGIDLSKLELYLEKRGILSFIDSIKEAGKKASQIILNMLQFSRKSESHMAPTDLTELVENVLDLAGKDYDLKKKYDFRSIKSIKEYDPDLPLVPCNAIEIEQVILNLLINAEQAMTEGNQKEPHQIAIRLLKDRNMVRIEIEDNGPGMTEAVRKRIFEPFYTTKPVGEGTGLGLSVSYMIITNNHLGLMEVESELGKGTKFIIWLPLVRDQLS